MSSRVLAACWACVLISATGCRMCASPYDYCGPLFGPGGDGNCHGDNPRQGSVLGCGGGFDGGCADGGCADGGCADGGCADGSCSATLGPGGDYAADQWGDPGYVASDAEASSDAAWEEGGTQFADGRGMSDDLPAEGEYEWQQTDQDMAYQDEAQPTRPYREGDVIDHGTVVDDRAVSEAPRVAARRATRSVPHSASHRPGTGNFRR